MSEISRTGSSPIIKLLKYINPEAEGGILLDREKDKGEDSSSTSFTANANIAVLPSTALKGELRVGVSYSVPLNDNPNSPQRNIKSEVGLGLFWREYLRREKNAIFLGEQGIIMADAGANLLKGKTINPYLGLGLNAGPVGFSIAAGPKITEGSFQGYLASFNLKIGWY